MTDDVQPSSLATAFAPQSIAVIGASAHLAGAIIRALQRHGYPGAIHAIGPHHAGTGSAKGYPSLADVSGDVDCVICGLAPVEALEIIPICAEKRVKLLVLASAGSGTDDGKHLPDELVAAAKASGIRVLGPNCAGFGNFGERIFASAAPIMQWETIPAGRIGLVTQSGDLGFATAAWCALEDGISFSHIVSTGSEADIDTIEVAEFFVDDPATDVIAMTLEAVKDTGRFLAMLERAGAAGKPVVVLRSGRSTLGNAMAASHTGALAGETRVFEAVCKRYGVTVAHDVDELYRTADMFAKLRASGKLATYKTPGQRMACLSHSGGHVGLFADLASMAGLAFPPFSEATKAKLAETLGFDGNVRNPLDITVQTTGDDAFWGRCVRVLVESGDIDLVVPILTVADTYEPAIRDLLAIAKERPEIIVAIWAGGSSAPGDRALIRDSLVPCFRMASDAAQALQALDGYAGVWNGATKPTRYDPPASSGGRAQIQKAIAAGKRNLTERESKEIFAAIGIPVTREGVAETADEATYIAESLGYPVVVKGEHPDIPHKSEAGLVILDVKDAGKLRKAFTTIDGRVAKLAKKGQPGRVLIQEMITPTQEMILGVTSDPEFGPVVLFGLGGIFVDVLGDTAMRLAPFTADGARAMIDELRGSPLLKGARGQPPVDIDGLARLLADFSAFAYAHRGSIAEIDINPLVARADGKGFCALDGLIVLKN
jgi:acetate---CoA ligase (ADP-forming)